MSTNKRGYSYKLVQAIHQGNTSKLGVALGKYCIDNDIPVQQIAKVFGVSRQTIYSWFTGVVDPHTNIQPSIQDYISGK